jgi:hypothetical protein
MTRMITNRFCCDVPEMQVVGCAVILTKWYKTYTQIPISTRKLLSYIHSHRVYIPLQKQLTDAIYIFVILQSSAWFVYTTRKSTNKVYNIHFLESV